MITISVTPDMLEDVGKEFCVYTDYINARACRKFSIKVGLVGVTLMCRLWVRENPDKRWELVKTKTITKLPETSDINELNELIKRKIFEVYESNK